MQQCGHWAVSTWATLVPAWSVETLATWDTVTLVQDTADSELVTQVVQDIADSDGGLINMSGT